MTDRIVTERLEQAGLAYRRYLEIMAEQAEQPTEDLPPEDAERVEFTRLNLHRTRRIGRTWRPDDELAELIRALATPQTWLVLTEPWCGDSAQCLPQVAVLADLNELVDLRILLRDDHPDVMDRYLTDGKRSIPIVAALDADGHELWRWGPRPAAAREVFDAARASGADKPEILEKLHLFYGRDRGRALAAEFTALLREAVGG